MTIKVPDNLILIDSKLHLRLNRDLRVNRTNESLIIIGTRNGFLSLANSLLFAVNMLENDISLSKLPFISCQIDFEIQYDDSVNDTNQSYPPVVCSNNNSFIWKMGYNKLLDIIASIHSLGYVNNEIHFDRGVPQDQISVYCAVE